MTYNYTTLFLFILLMNISVKAQDRKISLNYETGHIDIKEMKFEVNTIFQFFITYDKSRTEMDSFTVEIFGTEYQNNEGIAKFEQLVNKNDGSKTERSDSIYYFLPMQVPDKDFSNIKITRFRYGKKIEESTLLFRNKGGIKFDVSSGIFYTRLKDRNYVLMPADDGKNKIIEENTGNFRVGIGLLAHLHKRTACWLQWGGSVGFELNNDAKVGYLAGLSGFMGYERKFVITAGIAISKVKRISNLYKVDDPINPVIASVPTVDIWKKALFLALTYNF